MTLEPKDVQRLGSDLVKAATASEPADVMLSILSQLRTNVTATEDLLRTTKIGITVNKYKVHSVPEVARAAAECVAKWRRDVKTNAAAGGDKRAGKGGSPGGKGESAGGKGRDEGKLTGEKAGAGFKTSVPLDKRTSVTDKVDTEVTGNATRDNCLKLMYDGLANMSEESPTTVLTHATAIEAAAFTAYAPETSDAYKSKIRSLFQNLKSKSNPSLRLRIFDLSITPERFVRMSGEELKSKERREEDRQIQKENMDKAMVAQVEKSISSSLTCGKCGQKKVSYSQAQTRSADEPMTTFCECTVCGNRWKFS